MHVDSITVDNFRNITSLSTGFNPKVNVFHGSNGSGKTNLLEAVFVMCLGRSQRGAADMVLLRNGEDVYRLTGQVVSGSQNIEVAVAYQQGGRKKITIDSVTSRAADLYERFSVVAAGPEDSTILSGSPSVRRLFMDIYLSQYSRAYLADLSDYQRIVTQKNAALKNDMDPSPFNQLQVEVGSRIIAARRKFLSTLAERAGAFYADIAGGEVMEAAYDSKVPLPEHVTDITDIQNAFTSTLDDYVTREAAVQTSLVGPHRDDVVFTIGGLPARTHGSQGQWRTAAVSLKLAVFDILRQRRSTPPILLLDEIFAELDPDRSQHLVDLFADTNQVFLTTAVEPPATLLREARRFRIAQGRIEEVN